jgi:elongation factor P hydroxylase
VFNGCFALTYGVKMRGGADEPLYLPASQVSPAELIFRENFPASALHEAAHWCIAGAHRRNSLDFAYTYIAAPRSAGEQELFFAAELRTQSLESVFAETANVIFNPSADNLNCDISAFANAIARRRAQTDEWLNSSAGMRAMQFCQALSGLKEVDLTNG